MIILHLYPFTGVFVVSHPSLWQRRRSWLGRSWVPAGWCLPQAFLPALKVRPWLASCRSFRFSPFLLCCLWASGRMVSWWHVDNATFSKLFSLSRSHIFPAMHFDCAFKTDYCVLCYILCFTMLHCDGISFTFGEMHILSYYDLLKHCGSCNATETELQWWGFASLFGVCVISQLLAFSHHFFFFSFFSFTLFYPGAVLVLRTVSELETCYSRAPFMYLTPETLWY